MARLLLAPQVWRAERHHEMSMKPDMAHDHPELGQIGAQVRGPSNRFDGVAYVVRQGVGGDLDLDGAIAAGGADEFPVSGAGQS